MRLPRAAVLFALVMTVASVATGVAIRRLEWEPQAGFDILGILWLFSNLPNLVAWTGYYFLLFLTAMSWYLVWVSREQDLDPF